MTPIEFANGYIARGWNPVPVAWRTKRPIGDDWQSRKIDASNVTQYFDGTQLNVGVQLGPSSAGLTDVDLDCLEAVAIAPYVLPPTAARFGRVSRRDSHRLYITDLATKTENAVFQFRHPNTGEMLCELRVGGGGKGAQTVFPGSVHAESGEDITWDENGSPAVTVGNDLLRKVKELAAYCLIARYWPAEGARHVTAQALGGVLARIGYEPPIVRIIAEAIARAAGDPELVDRKRAAEDSARALADGKHVFGLPELARHVGKKIVAQAAAWLDYEKRGTEAKRRKAEDGSSCEDESEDEDLSLERLLGQQPKQADALIALAADAVLFHTADDTAFARIEVKGHTETWPILSRGFRLWLKHQYFRKHESAPNSEAVQTALGMLEAKAIFEGSERRVFTRVGSDGDRLYLDLCDEKWHAVEIDADGWRIVDDPPTHFIRTKGMLPLPVPARGGSIKALAPLINVKAEADFILIVSWLLAAFRDHGPYPILVVIGEQGSAKSTLMEILRNIIDPNVACLRAPPKDEEDLYITATLSHVMPFDNMGRLPEWLSDALARIATGIAFAKRKLFTDMDETLLTAEKPIAINSIIDIVGAADLGERSIFITPPTIEKNKRKDKKEIKKAFRREHSVILGALLDIVAHGLKALPDVTDTEWPRMADFARWATACETAFTERGAFKAAYAANRTGAINVLLEGDGVASAVLQLALPCAGRASDILTALNAVVGESAARAKGWPKSARGLSAALKRAAPLLREHGITVQPPSPTDGTRTWNIERTEPESKGDKPHEPHGLHEQEEIANEDSDF
jgi:Bifunctional DNA primase/polymerase, N-terminal